MRAFRVYCHPGTTPLNGHKGGTNPTGELITSGLLGRNRRASGMVTLDEQVFSSPHGALNLTTCRYRLRAIVADPGCQSREGAPNSNRALVDTSLLSLTLQRLFKASSDGLSTRITFHSFLAYCRNTFAVMVSVDIAHFAGRLSFNWLPNSLGAQR